MKEYVKVILGYFVKKFFPSVYQTKGTAAPIRFKTVFIQKFIGINRGAYWPVHYTSKVSGVKNITIGIGTAPGLSPGCYIQGIGKITIGDYTIVAPNVGIISSNHDVNDYSKHHYCSVLIGRYCWLGMNSVILPGVVLGDHTIVAAGAVVTKSFPDGYCIVGGNPAKLIRLIDRDDIKEVKNKYEYIGYSPASKFRKNK